MRRGFSYVAGVRLIVCALLVLLLAGCRLDARVDVTLSEDGTGRVEAVLVGDAELERRAAAAGVDLPRALAALADELEGWSATLSEDARQVRLVAEFADVDALEEGLAAFAEGLGAAELQPLAPLDITVDDREVAIAGAAALQPSSHVAELGLDVSQATSLLEETVDYRISVALPGELIAHNGDAVDDDGRVVWRVGAGERVELSAQSERPPDLPLAALGAAAAVLGFAALFVSRRLHVSRRAHRRRG